ncbi:MAG: hypothetical protein ACLU84_06355 [Clostridia bacterium]
MAFIGIIADEANENWMKKKLKDQLQVSESSILFIKEKSIENIKNIKFETVLLAREFKNIEVFKKLLEGTKYLVVNSDIANNLNILDNLELTVITYGFNSKATITASSVTEDTMLLCVQRNIQDIKHRTIEAQEISVDIEADSEKQVSYRMGVETILLLYGKIIS